MSTRPVFKGESFYVDQKSLSPHDVIALEKGISQLGGVIERFLSKEVNYLVTTTDQVSRQRTNNGSESSPKTTSPAATAPPTQSPAFMSRGKALLLKSHPKAAVDIVVTARQLGIKVVTATQVRQRIDKERSRKAAAADEHKRLNGTANKPPPRVLKNNFIKFEDTDKECKPVVVPFASFPRVDTSVEHSGSPFANVTQQQEKKSAPETSKKRKSKVGAKAGGYCELCEVHFPELKEHVTTSTHVKFMENKENFKELDGTIAKLPTLTQFVRNDVGVKVISMPVAFDDTPVLNVLSIPETDKNDEESESSGESSSDSGGSASSSDSDSEEEGESNGRGKAQVPTQDPLTATATAPAAITADSLYDSTLLPAGHLTPNTPLSALTPGTPINAPLSVPPVLTPIAQPQPSPQAMLHPHSSAGRAADNGGAFSDISDNEESDRVTAGMAYSGPTLPGEDMDRIHNVLAEFSPPNFLDEEDINPAASRLDTPPDTPVIQDNPAALALDLAEAIDDMPFEFPDLDNIQGARDKIAQWCIEDALDDADNASNKNTADDLLFGPSTQEPKSPDALSLLVQTPAPTADPVFSATPVSKPSSLTALPASKPTIPSATVFSSASLLSLSASEVLSTSSVSISSSSSSLLVSSGHPLLTTAMSMSTASTSKSSVAPAPTLQRPTALLPPSSTAAATSAPARTDAPLIPPHVNLGLRFPSSSASSMMLPQYMGAAAYGGASELMSKSPHLVPGALPPGAMASWFSVPGAWNPIGLVGQLPMQPWDPKLNLSSTNSQAPPVSAPSTSQPDPAPPPPPSPPKEPPASLSSSQASLHKSFAQFQEELADELYGSKEKKAHSPPPPPPSQTVHTMQLEDISSADESENESRLPPPPQPSTSTQSAPAVEKQNSGGDQTCSALDNLASLLAMVQKEGPAMTKDSEPALSETAAPEAKNAQADNAETLNAANASSNDTCDSNRDVYHHKLWGQVKVPSPGRALQSRGHKSQEAIVYTARDAAIMNAHENSSFKELSEVGVRVNSSPKHRSNHHSKHSHKSSSKSSCTATLASLSAERHHRKEKSLSSASLSSARSDHETSTKSQAKDSHVKSPRSSSHSRQDNHRSHSSVQTSHTSPRTAYSQLSSPKGSRQASPSPSLHSQKAHQNPNVRHELFPQSPTKSNQISSSSPSRKSKPQSLNQSQMSFPSPTKNGQIFSASPKHSQVVSQSPKHMKTSLPSHPSPSRYSQLYSQSPKQSPLASHSPKQGRISSQSPKQSRNSSQSPRRNSQSYLQNQIVAQSPIKNSPCYSQSPSRNSQSQSQIAVQSPTKNSLCYSQSQKVSKSPVRNSPCYSQSSRRNSQSQSQIVAQSLNQSHNSSQCSYSQSQIVAPSLNQSQNSSPSLCYSQSQIVAPSPPSHSPHESPPRESHSPYESPATQEQNSPHQTSCDQNSQNIEIASSPERDSSRKKHRHSHKKKKKSSKSRESRSREKTKSHRKKSSHREKSRSRKDKKRKKESEAKDNDFASVNGGLENTGGESLAESTFKLLPQTLPPVVSHTVNQSEETAQVTLCSSEDEEEDTCVRAVSPDEVSDVEDKTANDMQASCFNNVDSVQKPSAKFDYTTFSTSASDRLGDDMNPHVPLFRLPNDNAMEFSSEPDFPAASIDTTCNNILNNLFPNVTMSAPFRQPPTLPPAPAPPAPAPAPPTDPSPPSPPRPTRCSNRRAKSKANEEIAKQVHEMEDSEKLEAKGLKLFRYKDIRPPRVFPTPDQIGTLFKRDPATVVPTSHHNGAFSSTHHARNQAPKKEKKHKKKKRKSEKADKADVFDFAVSESNHTRIKSKGESAVDEQVNWSTKPALGLKLKIMRAPGSGNSPQTKRSPFPMDTSEEPCIKKRRKTLDQDSDSNTIT